SVVGDALQAGRLDRAAKRTAGAEPDVISQDQQDIGSVLRCLDTLRKIGCRVLCCTANLPLEWRFGPGKTVLRARREYDGGRQNEGQSGNGSPDHGVRPFLAACVGRCTCARCWISEMD